MGRSFLIPATATPVKHRWVALLYVLFNPEHKKNLLQKTLFFASLSLFFSLSHAQQKTYCNPVNLDYGYTPIPNFTNWGKHRATADPV
ncbi:MAG TPA: hypothetical protein VEY10_13185, partial [Flavisolibacter sp.]|nr:hypothetical protein [Flavisolibacter sp.]